MAKKETNDKALKLEPIEKKETIDFSELGNILTVEFLAPHINAGKITTTSNQNAEILYKKNIVKIVL